MIARAPLQFEYSFVPMVNGSRLTDPGRMLSVFVWMMAGTAMWHFAVLVPDRFYRGIIGSLVAANAGAIVIGLAGAGFALPSDTTLADAFLGSAGAVVALALSWLAGPRYDPVLRSLDKLVRF
jgi:hypothetical protein